MPPNEEGRDFMTEESGKPSTSRAVYLIGAGVIGSLFVATWMGIVLNENTVTWEAMEGLFDTLIYFFLVTLGGYAASHLKQFDRERDPPTRS